MTLRAARPAAALTAVLLATALPGVAAEPRSAIPWLSESIEMEGTPPPPSRSKAGRGQPGGCCVNEGLLLGDSIAVLIRQFPRLVQLEPTQLQGRLRLAQPAPGRPVIQAE